MKLNKRSVAAVSFVLGAVLLLTSAFADALLGSGYVGLKDAAKATAKHLTSPDASFSARIYAAMKYDGETVMETNIENRFDLSQNAKEVTETTTQGGKTRKNYYYNDAASYIIYQADADAYHVYEKTQTPAEPSAVLTNPFDEDFADDAERIADALVGTLSDVVQVEEADGRRMYTGNLSDAQIPALVNAVMSFAVKQGALSSYQAKEMGIAYPKSGIYVTGASGKAVANGDGILESVIGSFELTGTDKDGVSHLYTFELSVEFTDVGSATVTRPDLTGKKVEYSKEERNWNYFDEKFIGVYTSNVVEVEDGQFVKKGERVLEITSAGKDGVAGRYTESFTDPAAETISFDFTGEVGKDGYFAAVRYTQGGEELGGIIQMNGDDGSLYANLGIEDLVLPETGGWRSGGGVQSHGQFQRQF